MNLDHSPLVCVIPGDLHLTVRDRENYRVALAAIDEINSVIRPDVVQFIGDNVQDGTEEQFQLFQDLAERLQAPWHALVGDHDIAGDGWSDLFQACVGRPTGAKSISGFRLLRLNTQEAKPLGMSVKQVEWFRNEVDDAPAAGERVVVFQHNYPYQIFETFAGPGIDGWREVVQTRRIAAIVTGHTHYWQMANDGRNIAIATRSIGDPEGGAPGYLVLYLHSEDLAVTYREVSTRGPLVLVTHPREKLLATGPPHVVSGPDQFRVRVWSGEPVEEVRGQVDGGPWLPMAAVGAYDFVLPLAGDQLTKGEHRFRVRVLDGQGWMGEQEMEFAVDDTGRYTAVPGVRATVRETQFC